MSKLRIWVAKMHLRAVAWIKIESHSQVHPLGAR